MQVRILRVLEYTFSAEDNMEDKLLQQIDYHMAQRGVKGTFITGNLTIREAIVGQWPEVLGQEKQDGTPQAQEG